MLLNFIRVGWILLALIFYLVQVSVLYGIFVDCQQVIKFELCFFSLH
jgi:hypothetical protein